jgi:hypothetical protein
MVSRTATHSAIIGRWTRAQWTEPRSYHDGTKAYMRCVYECTDDLASFVELLVLPRPALANDTPADT